MSAIQTSTTSVEHYVPVHRRNSSSSSARPSMAAHPYIYSIADLLSMAPPSHVHGTESTSFELSSSPKSSSFHGPSTPSEPHQGWTKLNSAMRSYLRAACPEIAMNRKMRKSIEFHQIQHSRSSRQPHSPETKRTRSSSPAERKPPVQTEDGFELVQSHRRAPRTPPPAEAIKRARTPTPRRSRPTNSRTRHAHFTQLHLNAAAIAKATGGDNNWRVHGISAPLPTVSVA